MNDIPVTLQNVQVFLLILARVAPLFALLPVFGSPNVPPQVKACLSLVFSIALLPIVQVPSGALTGFSMAKFIVLVLKELCIGLTIGFAASFLFASVQFAGSLIDNQIGFSMVELYDPFTDIPVTVTGQFKIVVFSIVFLLTSGHHFLLLAIQKSFSTIPLLAFSFPAGPISKLFTDMTSRVFSCSLLLAAPILVVLIISSVGLAVIARTVPQINIFFVGVPLKIVLGLFSLAVTLPVLLSLFNNIYHALLNDIWTLLFLMA